MVIAPLAVELHFVTVSGLDLVGSIQSSVHRETSIRSAPQVAGGRTGIQRATAAEPFDAAEARSATWAEARWRLDRNSAPWSGVSCGTAGKYGARCFVHWPDGQVTRLRCPTFETWSDCRLYDSRPSA